MQLIGCANVSLVGNACTGENVAIRLGTASPNAPQSQSIAVIANTITNSLHGIFAFDTITLSLDQNQIAVSSFGFQIGTSTNFVVTRNTVFNANVGVLAVVTGASTGTISQNTIRNCANQGLSITSTSNVNLQVVANQFGECGLVSPTAVITVSPSSANSTALLNNVYAGHNNNLQYYLQSSAHLNFVSGNSQIQSVLPNDLP